MKNLNPLFLSFILLLARSFLEAQETVSIKNNCGFSRRAKESTITVRPAPAAVESVVTDMILLLKLPKNFSIRIYDGFRPLAIEYNGQRFLLLENGFEKRLAPDYPQRWVHLGSLAFLSGRHLLKHDLSTTDADRREQEVLAADRIAGIYLRMRGATFKETVAVYTSPNLPEEAMPGYPPYAARKQANQLGWESQESELRTTVLASDDQKPPELLNCAICPDMVFLRGGTFQMGNAQGVPNEQPVHTVTLRGFWIGKTEISMEQWRLYSAQLEADKEKAIADSLAEVYKNKGDRSFSLGWSSYKHFDKYSRGERRKEPCGFSWQGANEYCAYLTKKTGKKFRLPTEAEWEYAARGGALQENFNYSGSNDIRAVAWSSMDKIDHSQAISSKQPNSVGLFDMTGNIDEWCADCYSANYIGASPDGRSLDSGECLKHIARGGNWNSQPEQMRVTTRGDGALSAGLRVVMEQ